MYLNGPLNLWTWIDLNDFYDIIFDGVDALN